MGRKTPKHASRGLRVGSAVRFRFGVTDVTATVTEDRGPLGDEGEHIFRIRFQFGSEGEQLETEVEESRLTVVGNAT